MTSVICSALLCTDRSTCTSNMKISYGHAPRHVFESRAVGLIVRNVLQTRWRSGNFFYQRRQLVDGHLLVIADVDDLSDGCRRLGKAYQSLHYVAYVREATALFACLVDD